MTGHLRIDSYMSVFQNLKKKYSKKKIMTKHLKTLLEITPLYYNVLQMYVKMMLYSETVFKMLR